MTMDRSTLSRRGFCLCCLCSAAFAVEGWLSPRQVFAKARGIVDTIRDAAAAAEIKVYSLRGNVSVLEGSGGNVAVLTALTANCWSMRASPCPENMAKA